MLTPDVTEAETITDESRIVREMEEEDFKGLLDAAYNMKQPAKAYADQQSTRNLSQQAQNILKSEVNRARIDDLDQPLVRDIPQSYRGASRRLGKSASHEGYRTTTTHLNTSFGQVMDVPVDHTISLPFDSQVYLSPNNEVPKVEQMIRQQHHINKTSTLTSKSVIPSSSVNSLQDATVNGGSRVTTEYRSSAAPRRVEGGFADEFAKGSQILSQAARKTLGGAVGADNRSKDVAIDMESVPYIDEMDSESANAKDRAGATNRLLTEIRAFGSGYSQLSTEKRESLENPNINRSPQNYTVVRPELVFSPENGVFPPFRDSVNGDLIGNSRYGVSNRVQTVFPANHEVELRELTTVNEYKPLVNEDSDDETMDERKKKSQRREKEFSDNGFSMLPGRKDLMFSGGNMQPLNITQKPGYIHYGVNSPDAKLNGPSVTYGNSPQRKSRNRRRSDVTKTKKSDEIDGFRGNQDLDELLDYIEGGHTGGVANKDNINAKRQKKAKASNAQKPAASVKKHSSVGDADEFSDSDSPGRKTSSVSGEIARDLMSEYSSGGDAYPSVKTPLISPECHGLKNTANVEKEASPVKNVESDNMELDEPEAVVPPSKLVPDAKVKSAGVTAVKSAKTDQQKGTAKKSKAIGKSKSENELESPRKQPLGAAAVGRPSDFTAIGERLDMNKNEIASSFSCDMNTAGKRLEPLVVDTDDTATRFYLDFDCDSIPLALAEETLMAALPQKEDQFIPVTGRRQKKREHFRSYKSSDSFDKVMSTKRSVTPPPRDSPQWDEGSSKATDMSGLRRRRKSADYTPVMKSPASCYRSAEPTDFSALKSPNLGTDVLSEPPESDTHTDDGNVSVSSHTGNSHKLSYAAMARTSRPRPHSPALADFIEPLVTGSGQHPRKAPLSAGGNYNVAKHAGGRNDPVANESVAWGPTHGRNANSLNPSRSNSPSGAANVSTINSAVASSPDLKVFSMNSATDFPPPLPLLAIAGSSPFKNGLKDVYTTENISNTSPVELADSSVEGVATASVQLNTRLPPSGKTYATAATEKRPTAVVKPMPIVELRDSGVVISPSAPKHGLMNNMSMAGATNVQVGGSGGDDGESFHHPAALNLSSQTQYSRVELGKSGRGMSAEPLSNPHSNGKGRGKSAFQPPTGGGRPRAVSMDNQSGAGLTVVGGKPGKAVDGSIDMAPGNGNPSSCDNSVDRAANDSSTGVLGPPAQSDSSASSSAGINTVPTVNAAARDCGSSDCGKVTSLATTNSHCGKPVSNAVEHEPKKEKERKGTAAGTSTKAVEFLNEPAGAYPAKSAAFEGLTFGFDSDEGTPGGEVGVEQQSEATETSAESKSPLTAGRRLSPSRSATLSSDICSNATVAVDNDHPRSDPAVLVCGSTVPRSEWDRTAATRGVRGAVVKSRSFAGHDRTAVNNEVMLSSMVKFVEQAWTEFTTSEDAVQYKPKNNSEKIAE